jgi:hypothetical protein
MSLDDVLQKVRDAAIAEAEAAARERVSRRVKRTKAELRRQGRHMGGSIPFGWRRGGIADKLLIEIPEQQAACADIKAMDADGRSLMWIRDRMRERGFNISHNVVARVLGGPKNPHKKRKIAALHQGAQKPPPAPERRADPDIDAQLELAAGVEKLVIDVRRQVDGGRAASVQQSRALLDALAQEAKGRRQMAANIELLVRKVTSLERAAGVVEAPKPPRHTRKRPLGE